MTLSIIEVSLGHRVKNAALLSPCHNQISLSDAVLGRERDFASLVDFGIYVLALF
jgi:hypothetical protein